jgi:hypothetical protein
MTKPIPSGLGRLRNFELLASQIMATNKLPAVNEIVRLRRDLPCYSDYKDSELTVVCSRVHTESFDAQPKRGRGWRVDKIPPEHIEARGLGFLDLKKRGVGQTYGTSEHKRRKTQPIPPEKPPHVVQPPPPAFAPAASMALRPDATAIVLFDHSQQSPRVPPPPPPPAAPPAPAPALVATKFCIENGPACGPIPRKAKFCPHCGAAQH